MLRFTAQRNQPDEEGVMEYCCPMRLKYVIGIVAEDAKAPTPIDVIDYQDFDNTASDGRPVLRIKYCPFCGSPVKGPLRVE